MILFRRRIIRQVADILDAVADKLSPQNAAEAKELLDHNEWGLALSVICTQLREHDMKVSREIFTRIESVADMMELAREEWAMVEVED